MFIYDDRPIIACSTGTLTNTAIGLIRLSGFNNLIDLQKYFSLDLNKVKVRFAHMTDILSVNTILDNIVLTYYEGPRSYNGENILELAVHGNQINIRRIIDLFLEDGNFRHAKEGEFTYRALKNKKLSLSQVEGLDLLLNANSSLMLNQGIETMQGELHRSYLELYEVFVKLKASVELSIDFSEDVGDDQVSKLLSDTTAKLASQIDSLKSRTEGDCSSLMSPTIVLVGQTNAGKSSLFNKLLKNNRSIVSNQAGTTRDYVSETLYVDGVNYRFVDTAGIRETYDQVEKIGIERSFDILGTSFYKILVVNPLETDFSDFSMLSKTEDFDLLILTHKNQLKNFKSEEFCEKLPSFKSCILLDLDGNETDYKLIKEGSYLGNNTEKAGPMGAENIGSIKPEKAGPMGAENIGSKEPIKIGPMGAASDYRNFSYLSLINLFIRRKYNYLSELNPILIDRHRQVLRKISSKMTKFQEVTDDVDDIAIISSELNLLGHSIAELIGIVSPDDVLNSIFSNFCIGK